MKACTFFGHRDTKEEVEKVLRTTIEDLIKNKSVDVFYVGNHGSFDNMVKKVLEDLKIYFPHINFYVVTAYPSLQRKEISSRYIHPLQVRNIPERNLWMIENSDYVVTYVKKIFGGAARFKRKSIRQHKAVIELSLK